MSSETLSRRRGLLDDCLDIIAVWIEYERSKITIVVLGAGARRPVVATPVCCSCLIKGRNGIMIGRDERNMCLGWMTILLCDPEKSFPVPPISSGALPISK